MRSKPISPARKRLISAFRKYLPANMSSATAYNTRTEEYGNELNAVHATSYMSTGAHRELAAVASMLECQPSWPDDLAKTLQYSLFADRLEYFWHQQFRVVFPRHEQPLRMMSWEGMAKRTAWALMLGWVDTAIYQGYLTLAALNRGYQLTLSYEEQQRRGHAFLVRLFASWREDGSGHRFPEWAREVPVYEEVLDRWRSASADELGHLLVRVCDQHLVHGNRSEEGIAPNFGDDRLTQVPAEVLMVLRMREAVGLPVPGRDHLLFEHQLMEPPFDAWPITPTELPPDEYMLGTLARARADWPHLDAVTALDAVRGAARLPS